MNNVVNLFAVSNRHITSQTWDRIQHGDSLWFGCDLTCYGPIVWFPGFSDFNEDEWQRQLSSARRHTCPEDLLDVMIFARRFRPEIIGVMFDAGGYHPLVPELKTYD